MNKANIHVADYYRKKGFVSVADGDAFRTIRDIAETYGIPLTGPGGIKRGFNWLGGATCPNQPQVVLWWPTRVSKSGDVENSGGWGNEFLDNDQLIYESAKDHASTEDHVEELIAENRNRVVFAKEAYGRGGWCYRFVGLFKLNTAESRRLCKAVWERIPDIDCFNV